MNRRCHSTRACKALTPWEFLAIIVVAVVVVLFAQPFYKRYFGESIIHPINHARQIHLATQQMALDRQTTGDVSLGWPGDINRGLPTSADAADFAWILVDEGYIDANNMGLFAVGDVRPASSFASMTRDNVAFAIGGITEDLSPETLFIVSCNYIGPPDGLDPEQAPFGSRGWVMLRKGGNASSLRLKQARLDPHATEFKQQIGRLPPGWLGGANPTLPPVAD